MLFFRKGNKAKRLSVGLDFLLSGLVCSPDNVGVGVLG